MKDLAVVKVGGSLFDWPLLGPRLQDWLKTLSLRKILLVPGGGPSADVIRKLDRSHNLGEEAAHWLSIRALTVNAHFLAGVLHSLNPVIVGDLRECGEIWMSNGLPILDLFRFAQEDESHPNCLPHCWAVTSDSLAARVAIRFEALRLILLKSTTISECDDWMSSGTVDPYFPKLLRECHSEIRRMQISAINLREWREKG
jgi:5-(aminomethyl)-3-furanmethanol phosphate kinase